MPPQLTGKNKQTLWITSGHCGSLWINVNKSLTYFGIVAHECNIFAVRRQLVIISAFFILSWKREICCKSFTGRLLATTRTTLHLFGWVWSFYADIMWFMLLTRNTYKLVFAQKL